jgi:mevalonate kinase
MKGELLSSKDVDSSGISSSAAVGVACLLALEAVNDLHLSVMENVELDRWLLMENLLACAAQTEVQTLVT